MRKLVGIAAVCAAAMLFAGSVSAQEIDYTGDWYGEVWGTVIHVTINDDGTFITEINGQEDTYNWVATDAGVLLDRGMLLTWADGKLESNMDGMVITYTREKVEIFDPGQILFEIAPEDMNGTWKLFKVGKGRNYVDPADSDLADTEVEMTIEGQSVTLNGLYWENETFEMDFQDGQLFLQFPDSDGPYQVLVAQLLSSGYTRLVIMPDMNSDVTTMLLMDRADGSEAAVEEDTENAVE